MCYDPYVFENEFNEMFKDTKLEKNLYNACKDSDCIVIMTDHTEFFNINLKDLLRLMNTPCIVDGRHVIDPYNAIGIGFTYEGIGRPSKYFEELVGA